MNLYVKSRSSDKSKLTFFSCVIKLLIILDTKMVDACLRKLGMIILYERKTEKNSD